MLDTFLIEEESAWLATYTYVDMHGCIHTRGGWNRSHDHAASMYSEMIDRCPAKTRHISRGASSTLLLFYVVILDHIRPHFNAMAMSNHLKMKTDIPGMIMFVSMSNYYDRQN